MNKIKKGDIVARKSYGCDILFFVDKVIISSSGTSIAILKGVTIRIIADAPFDDLFVISPSLLKKQKDALIFSQKKHLFNLISPLKNKSRYLSSNTNSKILHLDGDRHYAEKSNRYYRKMGLYAIVRNVSEFRQPTIIKDLLLKYSPDILVITGHDSMIRAGKNYSDLRNYRNSKYFIQSVLEARKLKPSSDDLAIFAGACQSFYEAIIAAGANFASSPARILIDFKDPLIVAKKIATTNRNQFINIGDIVNELRDGKKGIDGIGTFGKNDL